MRIELVEIISMLMPLLESVSNISAVTPGLDFIPAPTMERDGVTAQFKDADGRFEEISARWILGCDGAHSTVRQLAGIPFVGGAINLSFFLGDLCLQGPDNPTDDLLLHLRRGDVVFLGPLCDKQTRVILAQQEDEGRDPLKDRPLALEDFQRALDDAGSGFVSSARRSKSGAGPVPGQVLGMQTELVR